MRCVLCKKALPKRGQRGRKGAHVDCLHIDEVESILATGFWIHPISGERKGTPEWDLRGVTTGRSSSASPNIQNLTRTQAKNLNFALAYGAGPNKVLDMLKNKAATHLVTGVSFSELEQRLVKELKLDIETSSDLYGSVLTASGSEEKP